MPVEGIGSPGDEDKDDCELPSLGESVCMRFRWLVRAQDKSYFCAQAGLGVRGHQRDSERLAGEILTKASPFLLACGGKVSQVNHCGI